MTSDMKKNLLWLGAGLLVAIGIFYAGMRFKQYQILSKPETVIIDTTTHSFVIPLKKETKTDTIYMPNPDRRRLIDSILTLKKDRDSLKLFADEHLKQFGSRFIDTTDIKDSSGSFYSEHWYDIIADPFFQSIQKNDIKNFGNWTSRDTLKEKYVPLSPTIGQRIQDVGILAGAILIIYFIFQYVF